MKITNRLGTAEVGGGGGNYNGTISKFSKIHK